MSTSFPYGRSEDSSYDSQTRSESKNDAVCEIGNHTWQFPPLYVARMLSAKTPKSLFETAGEPLRLEQYDCAVDGPTFQNALDDVARRLGDDAILTSQPFEYHDLAAFLNRCVEACHDALDKQQDTPLRQDRWYKDLRFTIRDVSPTCPGESVSPRPLIAGGCIFLKGDEVLYWNPLLRRRISSLTLPVEVGSSWKEIVCEASEDARRLFGASPMRSFALMLAFDQDEKALRFLIYHHGGITASESCDVTEPGGLKDIGRLFLALVSWTTPGDAGFVPSCTNARYLVPADRLGKDYVVAEVGGLLSWSLRIRGRMGVVSRVHLLQGPPKKDGNILTFHGGQHRPVNYVQPREIIRSESDPILLETNGPLVLKTSWPEAVRRGTGAAMYRDSNGRFGTIPHVCSHEAVDEHRQVISNILFVPRNEDVAKYHWPIFSDDPPEKPDVRTLWFTLFGVDGRSLTEATSPRQLSRAWAHFVLGWLSAYLSGYLHRDVSIESVFMTKEPVKRKTFEMPEGFMDHLFSLGDGLATAEILGLYGQVEQLVARLGISNECTGFIADGDTVVSWDDYLSEGHRGSEPGTPEFMSLRLTFAAQAGISHLHSPVDDLESCFWVALWSVLFNKDNQQSLSEAERTIKENLTKTIKVEAAPGLWTLRLNGCSNIMQRFRPVLKTWWKSIRDNGEMWTEEVLDKAPKDAGREYYLPHFHISALRGVVDVLQVISGYWDGEIGWESWTMPTLPAAVH